MFTFFFFFFFFFNDTATTEIYTLSLHDALPILERRTSEEINSALLRTHKGAIEVPTCMMGLTSGSDRKSTRLNSSHVRISYAVFCLKKKKKKNSKNNKILIN